MSNKKQVAENFSKCAASYEEYALLQKQMADDLIAGLPNLNPKAILDVGCGTGYLTLNLAQKFPQGKIIGIDNAPKMIEIAQSKTKKENLFFQLADGEGLPFTDNHFDLVLANASLQWMEGEKAVCEIARVLKKAGKFIFKTFGPATLKEVRVQGFQTISLHSPEEWRGILNKYFQAVKLETGLISLCFDNLKEALRHLKRIGANSTGGRKPPLAKHFPAIREMQPISVTFEIISGQAIK